MLYYKNKTNIKIDNSSVDFKDVKAYLSVRLLNAINICRLSLTENYYKSNKKFWLSRSQNFLKDNSALKMITPNPNNTIRYDIFDILQVSRNLMIHILLNYTFIFNCNKVIFFVNITSY